MHKYLHGYLYGLISIIALASCTYEPDEIILTEIDRDISDIQVGFTANQDTIEVFGFTRIQFNYEFEGREIIEYTTFLNDQELENGIQITSNGNFVSFDSNQYNDGYYNLTIGFVIRSGSGSLADQAGAEFITVELSQTILIDNVPVVPLQIVEQRIVDGQLQLKWNKYNGFGFQNYFVAGCEVITDANDTTATLCNYAGGSIELRLGLQAKDQYVESTTIYEDNLNAQISESESEINITWDPTPYFKDFSFYRYSYTDNTGSSSFVDEQIFNINETSRRLAKNGFPSSYTISGRLLNSFFIEEQTIGDDSYDVTGLGTFLKKATEINSEVFLAKFQSGARFSSVIYYDTKSGRELAVVDGVSDMSNDGEDIFHFVNGSINKMSNTQFEILESYSIGQNSQLGVEIRDIMALGNNRLLLHAFYADNSAGMFIMDYSTKSLTRTSASPFFLFEGLTSDDGRYIYSNNGVPSIGVSIYDLLEDGYADPAQNGSRIPNAFFIASSNRLLKFDESNLYTTDLEGGNRTNLNNNQNIYSTFRSIDGENILAYNEVNDSNMNVFNTSTGASNNSMAQYKSSVLYNIIDNRLIGFANRKMFVRTLE